MADRDTGCGFTAVLGGADAAILRALADAWGTTPAEAIHDLLAAEARRLSLSRRRRSSPAEWSEKPSRQNRREKRKWRRRAPNENA